MAENVFGRKSLMNALIEMLAPSVLALLCKDSELESSFTGINLTGFDFGFCNSTRTVQTDVGVCIASNPRQISKNGEVLLQEESKKMGGGLKDIEHVMIIQVDKFGYFNQEESYKVS